MTAVLTIMLLSMAGIPLTAGFITKFQVILDDKSAVKNAWGLREKDSVIILLDKTGKVQFVKEGKLTDDEVKEVISRVTALIAK